MEIPYVLVYIAVEQEYNVGLKSGAPRSPTTAEVDDEILFFSFFFPFRFKWERRMLKVKKKEKGKLAQSEARLSIKANDLVGDGPLLMPLFKMYTVVDVKEKLLHGLSLYIHYMYACYYPQLKSRSFHPNWLLPFHLSGSALSSSVCARHIERQPTEARLHSLPVSRPVRSRVVTQPSAYTSIHRVAEERDQLLLIYWYRASVQKPSPPIELLNPQKATRRRLKPRASVGCVSSVYSAHTRNISRSLFSFPPHSTSQKRKRKKKFWFYKMKTTTTIYFFAVGLLLLAASPGNPSEAMQNVISVFLSNWFHPYMYSVGCAR